MVDSPETSKRAGDGAQAKGSLVGFIVANHSLAGDGAGHAAMTDAEIGELKRWFDSGAADERMRGAVATGMSV